VVVAHSRENKRAAEAVPDKMATAKEITSHLAMYFIKSTYSELIFILI
jgi:hypothetical protein